MLKMGFYLVFSFSWLLDAEDYNLFVSLGGIRSIIYYARLRDISFSLFPSEEHGFYYQEPKAMKLSISQLEGCV